MNTFEPRSCTSVLVASGASLNGSTLIARNEDFCKPVDPKTFQVRLAQTVTAPLVSKNTGVSVSLPEKALRYTTTPSRESDEIGEYGESGINEAGVAMSATESLYGNQQVLALDPLVNEGIAEDALLDLVLPFVHSAREAVTFLGNLIETYGSAEGNGILFSDQREVWYMEIPCGHHWLAQRLPEDFCGVAPNQCVIGEVDLGDTHSVLCSQDLAAWVEANRLNPDYQGFNFRHIFGTQDETDRHYNTPRSWYMHRMLRKDSPYQPEDSDIPFLVKPDRKLSVFDVAEILGSHYQGTPYDPLDLRNPEVERLRYRPIGLVKTQESHILELRPDCPVELAGIHWLNFATPCFTPYVPFFSNVSDTPAFYRDMTPEISLDNAYWCFKLVSYYTERHYAQMRERNRRYLTDLNAWSLARVAEITRKASGLSGEALTAFLTQANEETALYVKDKTQALLRSMMTDALNASRLSYQMIRDL